MTRSVEIPGAAVEAARAAYSEACRWQGGGMDGADRFRFALAAALPYLAPAAQPYVEDESDSYAWPSGLSPENTNLTPAPAEPAIDREAVEEVAADILGLISPVEMRVNLRQEEVEDEFSDWSNFVRTTDKIMALMPAAPAGDGGLREALAELLTDIDGNEYEHNEGCQGEPECPACWAQDLQARLDAHPGAPAVPQPVARYRLAWLSARRRASYASKAFFAEARAAREMEAAVPQPVDREALAKALRACICASLPRPTCPLHGDEYARADAVLAVLAGEQEQVEP